MRFWAGGRSQRSPEGGDLRGRKDVQTLFPWFRFPNHGWRVDSCNLAANATLVTSCFGQALRRDSGLQRVEPAVYAEPKTRDGGNSAMHFVPGFPRAQSSWGRGALPVYPVSNEKCLVSGGQQTFSVKPQIVNIVGFWGHTASDGTIQLCHRSARTAVNNMPSMDRGCEPLCTLFM